ncbi:MAG: hypothetical protein K8S99_11205 [Planctomycetes bacterium]|nr:hypothetical protein [Planctomycetota bacterium]
MPPTSPHRLLEELIRLEAIRDPKCGESKRAYSRFVVRGDAELTSVERSRLDIAPLPILLRDIGRGGLGFVSQKPLEAGSVWRVGFLQNGYVLAQQALIVRHCKMVRADLYLIGSQFCIETGLMCLLGVNPGAIADGDHPTTVQDTRFLPPAEVA